MTDQTAFDWRAHLPVHPAAEDYPLMSEAELEELARDIEANGLLEPIIIFYAENDPSKSKPFLLDGRNRLDALVLAGSLSVDDIRRLHIKARGGSSVGVRYHFERDQDPYALALSYNVHRRHLTNEQKREFDRQAAQGHTREIGSADRQAGECRQQDGRQGSGRARGT